MFIFRSAQGSSYLWHFLLLCAAICTTTDVDALLYHMNNARYLRELDFARADFYERTDLYREVCSQGSGVVQGAATIRYRRFIKPLTIFKITSKVIIESCTISLWDTSIGGRIESVQSIRRKCQVSRKCFVQQFRRHVQRYLLYDKWNISYKKVDSMFVFRKILR